MSFKPDFDSCNFNIFRSPEGFTYYHFMWPIGKLPTKSGAVPRKSVTFEVGLTRFRFTACFCGEPEEFTSKCVIVGSVSNIFIGRAMLSSESTASTLYGPSAWMEDLPHYFDLPIIEDESKQAATDYVIHYWIDRFDGAYEEQPMQETRELTRAHLYSSDMAKYFDSVKSNIDDPPSCSDIVLVTKRAADGEERRFYCHRNILAARSPVFKTMVTNQGFEESRKRLVDIEDVSSECMEKVLKYIYTSNCDVGTEEEEVQSKENALKRLFDILHAAQKYALPELVDLCGKRAVSFVDDADRLEVLRVAELHNLAWLKRLSIMALSTNMTIFDEEECRGKISDEGLTELGKMCAERARKTKDVQVSSGSN